MVFRKLIGTAALIAASVGLAYAGGHGGNPAVKARQAHMQLNAFNLSVLGAMAKGEREYNADAASAAANNLNAMAGLSHMNYWPAGTSTDELGDETRALPALWNEGGFAKAGEIGGALAEATANLAAVAGNGQEAIGPALGAVGQQCTACHKEFQQPRN
ncbi:MAG: cytochrome c [Silicimonas sp.]|nr:cytochrome c [Silicimonas sp.]